MGARVAELGSEEICRVVPLDKKQLEEARSHFPFQQDADQFTLV